MRRGSHCYRRCCSRKVVIEEEREEFASIEEDNSARLCVHDVGVVFRDLKYQAASNASHHLGNEGCNVSGEGV